MPPPSCHPSLHLQVLTKRFFVARLQPGVHLPPCISRILIDPGATMGSGFLSVTRTMEETSLVGESHKWMPISLEQHSGWRCIKIKGPMEHDLTGVMAAFTAVLKEADIPVFAVSTWNTDYLLLPVDRLADAIQALASDGWAFVAS